MRNMAYFMTLLRINLQMFQTGSYTWSVRKQNDGSISIK